MKGKLKQTRLNAQRLAVVGYKLVVSLLSSLNVQGNKKNKREAKLGAQV